MSAIAERERVTPIIAPPGLIIRELTVADRRSLAFSLDHLGAQSRYQRYLSPRPKADERELTRLLDLDHWHHEGIIAFATAPRRPVGIAEYVRLPEAFDRAELAVAVVDEWQRLGVGRALAQALRERALAAGVRHFRLVMLRENRGALALARALGPRESTTGSGSLLEITVALERRP